MQLTMLKVMAILNVGFSVAFPWWMWLWGIISEFNGLICAIESLEGDRLMNKVMRMDERIKEEEERHD